MRMNIIQVNSKQYHKLLLNIQTQTVSQNYRLQHESQDYASFSYTIILTIEFCLVIVGGCEARASLQQWIQMVCTPHWVGIKFAKTKHLEGRWEKGMTIRNR